MESMPPEPAGISRAPAVAVAPAFGVPVPARSGHNTRVALAIIGICIAGVALLLVTAVVLFSLGPMVFVVGGLMALVPLAIVIAGTLWVDRWEPEPRGAVWFAFLWGAGVSVLAALLVGWEVEALVSEMGGASPEWLDLLGSTVQAPLVEEVGKGFALLLIFWVARKHFDGPVDGVVYAAWVAAGFAFSENILYFGGQIIEAGTIISADVFLIFLVRGLMSPFAHVMFTACTGIALGFAAERGVGALGGVWFWLLGLIPAFLLHAFWNGALYFVSDFFAYFFLIQFPLFLGVVAIVIGLRRRETRVTRLRLGEYAAAGWLHPAEVDVLATPAGRKRARAWAAANGQGILMRSYVQDATKLAAARQRIIAGRGRAIARAAVSDETELLHKLLATRAALGG